MSLALALALCLVSPATAAAPDDLVAEAVAANPGLEARRAHERMLREQADVAGAWPDPMIGVEYSNAPVTSMKLSEHPMSGLQLRAQQMVPTPGWSGRRRAVQELGADVAGHEVAEAEVQLEAAVRRAWWSLVRTRLLEEVTRDHVARTEELLAAVRARYETGNAGQSAVLRLEVLRDRLDDQLDDFTRDDRALTASLDRALGRDGGDAYDTPDAVAALPVPEDGDWHAVAREHRPALDAVDADVARWEAAAALARLEAAPDLTVWAGYRVRSVETATDPGTDLVSAGVSVPLPLGSARRAHGQRDAALEGGSGARAREQALADEVGTGMTSILARWERAFGKAATYDDVLLPAARTTLDTTQADYAVGRADFASLFDAEVTLLDLERARIMAAVDTHLLQAEAIALLGTTPPGGTP